MVQAAAAELARALRGVAELVRDPATSDEATGVWGDGDYLYIEASLPGDLDAFFDVSTCGRTFLVRLARGPDGGS